MGGQAAATNWPGGSYDPETHTVFIASTRSVGTFGLVLVIIMSVVGFSAEWLSPYNPTANDFAAMTEPPSIAHWLGTDQFGRDLLSRIIHGARTALGRIDECVGKLREIAGSTTAAPGEEVHEPDLPGMPVAVTE